MEDELALWNADLADTQDGRWGGCGPLILQANAGTGKTYSLVRIVGRWLHDGLILPSILVLTFTRKAAAEMKDRLARYLRENSKLERAVWSLPTALITTIHGFCNWVRTQYPEDFEFPREPLLLSEKEFSYLAAEAVLRREDLGVSAVRELGLEEMYRILANALVHSQRILDRDRMEWKPSLAFPNEQSVVVQIARKAWSERHALQLQLARDTYNAMVERLAMVLESPKGEKLRQRLRQRFLACVVDEFQDTDAYQWRVLRALFPLEERSRLVLIGDPKQSIYAFRGADLRIYYQAVDEVRHVGGVQARLGVNYRTVGPLLAKVNRLSERLFSPTRLGEQDKTGQRKVPLQSSGPPTQDQGWKGQLSYDVSQWSTAAREDLLGMVWAGQQGGPDLVFVPLRQDGVQPERVLVEQLRDRMLKAIVQLIRRWYGRAVRLPREGNRERTLSWRDFAVLTDSNSRIVEVMKALREAGLPAVSSGRGRVWESPAALAVMRLLRFLEQPTDPSRLEAVLYDLWVWAKPHQVREERSFLRRSLEKSLEAGCRLYREGRFRALEPWVGTWCPVWPGRLLSSPEGPRLYADLLHVLDLCDAWAASRGDLSQSASEWVASRILGTQEQVEEDDLRLERAGDAVRVLTLHKAKGLEFPVVFLHYGLRDNRLDYTDKLDSTEADVAGVAVWRGEQTGRAKGEWTLARNAEDLPKAMKEGIKQDYHLQERRNWYVGLTRAQLALVLPYVEPQQGGRRTKLQDFLIDYVRIRELEDLLVFERVEAGVPEPPKPSNGGALVTWVPLEWQPRPARLIGSFSSWARAEKSLRPEEERETDDTLPDDAVAGTWFGELFHKAMELWDWKRQVLKEFLDQIDAPAWSRIWSQRPPHLDPKQVRQELSNFMAMTVSTPLDPLGGLSLGDIPAADIIKERKFLLSNEEGFLKGVVDLVIRQGRDLFLIDYKTNRVGSAADWAEVMERHLYHRQAELYLQALERAFASHPKGYRVRGALYVFVRYLPHGQYWRGC